jgi:hypothetical protein
MDHSGLVYTQGGFAGLAPQTAGELMQIASLYWPCREFILVCIRGRSRPRLLIPGRILRHQAWAFSESGSVSRTRNKVRLPDRPASNSGQN